MSAETPDARSKSRATFAICAALLIAFALLSFMSVSTKSATSDEPLHVAGAHAHVFMRDYRLNPEDPPLWNYWVTLPRSARSLHIPTDSDLWPKLLDDTAYGMPFASVILFTSENDGAQFIQSSRAMMVLLGVALGAILAVWGWQIAGRVGAIVATTLFAFDPNFLAHAGLVKNDVALTLVMTAMCFAVYRVGRRATVLNVLCAAVLLGAGITTKFSGVLLAPIFVAMMIARAFLSGEWNVLGRAFITIRSKLLVATSTIVFAAIVAWFVIWLAYGFRFDPTPQPGARLNMQHVADRAPGAVAETVTWMERHRILPQAWLYGFLYTYQSTLSRASFLLGEIRDTGWWYYFPMVLLFKTPIATLAACGFALITWFAQRRCHPERYSAKDLASHARPDVSRSTALYDKQLWWMAACLMIPLAIYLIIAMTSNLNLGIRHVLPIYPFVFLLIALAAAKLASIKPRLFKWSASILATALVIETLAAFPNYLAFFNAPSRPHQLHLLSDSNLDWGQDLLLLGRWQDANPNTRLYLNYFGSVDPAAYGIRYINLPGSIYLNPESRAPDLPGVIAISASRLQGMHMSPELREFYRRLLKDQKPIDVLGGSIYLFVFPPVQSRT